MTVTGINPTDRSVRSSVILRNWALKVSFGSHDQIVLFMGWGWGGGSANTVVKNPRHSKFGAMS